MTTIHLRIKAVDPGRSFAHARLTASQKALRAARAVRMPLVAVAEVQTLPEPPEAYPSLQALAAVREASFARVQASAHPLRKSTAAPAATAASPFFYTNTKRICTMTAYILLTERDGENSELSLYSTREAAEAAIQDLAMWELTLFEDDHPSPVTLNDCVAFLVEECRYVDVRVTRACLGEGPGEIVYPDVSEREAA